MKAVFAAASVAALCVAAHAAGAVNTSADARFKAITTKEWVWRKVQLALHDEGNKREPIPDYFPSETPTAEAARL